MYKNLKNSFKWIPGTRCIGFWVQFGIRMSYLRARRVFAKYSLFFILNYLLFLSLFTYRSLSLQKISKKKKIPREHSEKECSRFRIQFGVKIPQFVGQWEFFQNISYCHHHLLLLFKAAVSWKFGHCYFLRNFFDALCGNC